MSKRGAQTTYAIHRESDEVAAEALHEHNSEAIDQGITELAAEPIDTVSSDEVGLGFDPKEFEPIQQTHYKQPELPFKPEFRKKAHLWQFSWVKWTDKDRMTGTAETGYTAIVKKGDSYRGHKYDDMFVESAFNLDDSFIGKGKEWDVGTKAWVASCVLGVRPQVAFEQDQKARVKQTENLFRNDGREINSKLVNIVESTAGDVTIKSDEPGKAMLRGTSESRWVKTNQG